MALRRFTASIDGTIPIPALLYDDEDLLASQDSVGIYDGLQKAVNHQYGAIHVSSHRLFFVNSHQPISHSFCLDLVHITRTDYYAGLLMSSPKVTLYLDPTFFPQPGSQDGTSGYSDSWICEVCNHRNPPGLSPAAARICTLCGVPRSALPGPPRPRTSTASASQPELTSLPVALSTLPRSSTPPPPTSESSPIACSACTFLNHPTLRNCEICSTPLPLASTRFGINSKSAPSSRPVSPPIEDNVSDPDNPLIKLSFRKGGDKPFYAILRRAVKAKAWEGRQVGRGTRSGSSSHGVASPDRGSTSGPLRRLGIDGILHNVEASAQSTETELSDTFKDLEALMVKAHDLVHLAAELNEKLNAPGSRPTVNSTAPTSARISSGSGSTPLSSSLFATTSFVPSSEPEEAKFILSSLAQLGLQLPNAPVTADMLQDERTWLEELARELGRVLQGSGNDLEGSDQRSGGIMKERGIIGLDEVWGGWNRARGVALIPPSTFLQVLQHLHLHTMPPLRGRVFKSGLQVLHTPAFTHAAFAARLSSYLTIFGGQTTNEIAQVENITISLASEMILAVEVDGVICRDDQQSAIRGGGSGSGSELRWALNKFAHYDWDGEVASY